MSIQNPREVIVPGTLAHLTSGNPETLLQSSASMNPILQSSSSINDVPENEFKLSKRRWLVLMAFSLFGLTIALTDITSPILILFLELLDLDIKEYNYLQPIFYYVMVIFAFPTAMFVDKYGIKRAMHTSAGLFVIHGFIRALMFFPELPYHSKIKFPCYIISSMFGVEMMTMFFLLPMKVSETWFSSSERSVAWAFMISQLNVGICIASFVYPRIITTLKDFKILAYVNIACVIVTAVSSILLVTRAEPEHPPNERVAKANKETPRSFKKSLVKMVKHRDMLVHLIHLAIFESLTLSVDSNLQDILKSIGLDGIFTGNLMSANAFITIIMQVLVAFFVNAVKNHTFNCKLGSFLQGILFAVYLLTIIMPQKSWILVSISFFLTVCKSWVTPNFTNMTAHLSCGVVSQATVVGFTMFLIVIVKTVINIIFTKLIVISGEDTHYYEHALIFLCVLSLLNEIFYLGFFHGQSNVNVDEGNQQI